MSTFHEQLCGTWEETGESLRPALARAPHGRAPHSLWPAVALGTASCRAPAQGPQSPRRLTAILHGLQPVPASSEGVSEDSGSPGEARSAPGAAGLPGCASSSVSASCWGVDGSLCTGRGPLSGLHALLSASGRKFCCQPGLPALPAPSSTPSPALRSTDAPLHSASRRQHQALQCPSAPALPTTARRCAPLPAPSPGHCPWLASVRGDVTKSYRVVARRVCTCCLLFLGPLALTPRTHPAR